MPNKHTYIHRLTVHDLHLLKISRTCLKSVLQYGIYSGHIPNSRGWGSAGWHLPPLGRGHRYRTWSRTQTSYRPCPAQTCTRFCCLAQPRTPPPVQSSGCAASQRPDNREGDIFSQTLSRRSRLNSKEYM